MTIYDTKSSVIPWNSASDMIGFKGVPGCASPPTDFFFQFDAPKKFGKNIGQAALLGTGSLLVRNPDPAL